MTKLAIATGLLVLLLAVGYGTPPDIRHTINGKLATFEVATETEIDGIPSPSAATWRELDGMEYRNEVPSSN